MSDPEVIHLLYGIPCDLSSDFMSILDRNGSFMRFSAITYACTSIGEKCSRSVKVRPGPNSDVSIRNLHVNHLDECTPVTIKELQPEKSVRAIDLSVQLSAIVSPSRENRFSPLTFIYPPDPWRNKLEQVEDLAPGIPAVALAQGQGTHVDPDHYHNRCCTVTGGKGLDAKSALDPIEVKPSELNGRHQLDGTHHVQRPSANLGADKIASAIPGNAVSTEKIVANKNFVEKIIDIEANFSCP